MISLTGKPGSKKFEIEFSPRNGFEQFKKEIRKGIFAYVCPTCSNVVMALFITHSPINLWPYEETNILSSDKTKYGEVLKVIPDSKSVEGETQYNINIFSTMEGTAQLITMKNHILHYHGIDIMEITSGKYFQPGERPCLNVCCYSLKPELYLSDLYRLWGGGHKSFEGYNLPPLEEIVTEGATLGLRLLEPYGTSSPLISFPRQKVAEKYGTYAFEIDRLLRNYRKR